MELFHPSKKVLESISCNPDVRPSLKVNQSGLMSRTHHIGHFTLTQATNLDLFIEGLLHQIGSFYFGLKGIDFINSQSIGMVVYEGLKNARWHGSRGVEPYQFGLFLGQSGACYGFRDVGKYFKDPETKRIFENKIPIVSFDKTFANLEGSNDAPGFEAGVNRFLFPESDLIEVDTGKGVLYLVQSKERLSSKN